VVEGRSLETKKLDVSSSDVRETRSRTSVSRINNKVTTLLTIDDEEVDRVGGVAGHGSTSLVDHLFDVTVISSDDADTLLSKDNRNNTRKLVVDDFKGLLATLDIASVTDHIRVSIVDTDPLVFLGLEGSKELVSDLLGLHLRVRLSKLIRKRRNFFVELKLLIHVTTAVTVPEEGNVAKLVGFSKSIAANARSSDELRRDTHDVRRRNEEGTRNVPLSIVLHKTSIVNLRTLNTVKALEFVTLIKGLADLNSTITTEVPVDHTITILHLTNGLTVLANDNEGRVELIELLRIDATSTLDSLTSALEVTRILIVDILRSDNTTNMSIPTTLDDAPVALITIHGDIHTATTRGDEGINTTLTDLLELLLKHVDVLETRVRSDITTIKKDVHTDLLDTGGNNTVNHLEDLVDVRVHITIRKKTEHVDSLVGTSSRSNDLVPVSSLEESTTLKTLLNKLCTLAVNLTTSKSIVTDLTVTHIRVRGKTHSRTVSLDEAVKLVSLSLFKKTVVEGHRNLRDRIAWTGLGNTKTINNDKNNRAFTRSETLKLLQRTNRITCRHLLP